MDIKFRYRNIWFYLNIQENTILDNQSFYGFEIRKRMKTNYINFKTAVFFNPDSEYAFEDYLPADTDHKILYVVNSDALDDSGFPNQYGTKIPACGIYYNRIYQNNQKISTLTFSTYFNNTNLKTGYPTGYTDYHGYMTSKCKDSGNFTLSYSSSDPNFPIEKFVNNSPLNINDCQCNNAPNDKKGIGSFDNISLLQNVRIKMKFVAVIRQANTNCSILYPWETVYNTIISELKTPSHIFTANTVVQSIPDLKIFPSMISNTFYLESTYWEKIKYFDMTTIDVKLINHIKCKASPTQIDCSQFPNGMYLIHVKIRNGDTFNQKLTAIH